MTLEEAVKIMGVGLVAVMINVPGMEALKLQLYHAIVEEWLDGGFSSVEESAELIQKYGTGAYQQAARVIANKVGIYGDVE